MPDKNALLNFLNLAADYLKTGHLAEGPLVEEQGLPLAYLIEEDENPEKGEDSLQAIAEEVADCRACPLCETRTLAVPGEGPERPLVMVIGEGPGADEDKAGRPFVGKAGQLLDRMLQSITLSREKNCFIANMVKCRPPGNRDPAQGEIEACFPFLRRQILLLKPMLILCAGRVSARSLLNTEQGINALRGQFIDLKIADSETGEEITIPVLPSYHPSALLRDESLKRPAWEDLKMLKSRLISLESLSLIEE
ncbi:MAG: uracil-DNA glycosylase [Treponema sp.]|nr:uracil-DNA glycosylase [Treponema sp.]